MPKPNHPNPNQVARMMRDTNNDDPNAAVQATLALPLTLASPLPHPCLTLASAPTSALTSFPNLPLTAVQEHLDDDNDDDGEDSGDDGGGGSDGNGGTETGDNDDDDDGESV
jgi:hypothetical protein